MSLFYTRICVYLRKFKIHEIPGNGVSKATKHPICHLSILRVIDCGCYFNVNHRTDLVIFIFILRHSIKRESGGEERKLATGRNLSLTGVGGYKQRE